MRKKNIFNIICILSALILSSSCNLNNDWEEKEKEEISRLENHIASLKSQGAVIVDNELGSYTWYYEELSYSEPIGVSPVLNDYIIVDYVRKNLEGDILYTNIDSLATGWDRYNDNKDHFNYYLFVPYKFVFGYNTPAFNAGVAQLKEGQKARIYYPSGLGFGDHVTLIDEVKLHRVITDIEEYDSIQFVWARNQFGFDASTYISGSDIFYKEIAAGDTSIDIGTNDSLLVKIVAYYLQEESLIRFDSIWGTSDATVVTIPSTRSKVETFTPKGHVPLNKGFAAAMDTIAIGAEAMLLVPYSKGFLSTGIVHSLLGYPVVPPYTSLLYRFKVVDIK